MKLNVEIATETHVSYARAICQLIDESARERGIGRRNRKPELIANKITNGQAIISLHEGELAGFSYIDSWDNGSFVANTGLVIASKFRSMGLAKKIKTKAIKLVKSRYPNAKMFSITTSPAVMKINNELGYSAVTYTELPKDQQFWKGCESCPNYQTLKGKNYKMCFCTAMLLLASNNNQL